MDLVFTSFFWITLGQIMIINILLSGDNAVVIALASRNLPPKQQRHAILLGSLGAIVLRVILTFFAVALLSFSYLKVVGAVLLVWIGIKMLVPEDDEHDLDAHSGLWAAIRTIIMADFIMSLDNVLGVAAAAKGHTLLLIIGLATSIPLIIYGSTLVLKLMERFGFIVVLGAGLLGWVAGEMFVTDPAVAGWVETQARWAHTVTPLFAAILVITAGMWMARRARESAPLAVALPVAESDQAVVIPLVADLPTRPVESHPAAGPAVHDTAKSHRIAGVELMQEAASIGANAHAEPICADHPPHEAPVGYRWISSPWRDLPDGTRDYAVTHGRQAFYRLAPISSHVRRRN